MNNVGMVNEHVISMPLFFREIHIDRGERDGMECKVPCCIPGILPLARSDLDAG